MEPSPFHVHIPLEPIYPFHIPLACINPHNVRDPASSELAQLAMLMFYNFNYLFYLNANQIKIKFNEFHEQ